MASGLRKAASRCVGKSRSAPARSTWLPILAGVGCVAASSPALAEKWTVGANAGLIGTYTTDVNADPQGDENGDFVTSLSAAVNIRGEGARVQVGGSIGASWQLYASETQNNSIAPNVNLFGRVEAIENLFFVDATANASTSFVSPFGPQPASIVNATDNRYISQNYSVSPYVQGELGSSNVAYRVRFDNYWSVASSFGDSSARLPNTYSNALSASLNSGTGPWGWTAEYVRNYYDSGTVIDNSITQTARLIVSYAIDPQVRVSGRVGYERNEFPEVEARDTDGTIYGAGFQWAPTERTSMGGFWEHRFFGSSFQWQISHRMPNAALTANFSRGLNSFPQLALLIPAGVTVTQFLDAAFTTRIPDPAERASAVEEFLARTGLPPTLAAPVNIYGTTMTIDNVQSVSLVLVGVRNATTFTVFNRDSTSVAGTGEALPPQLAFGRDNTQTGFGIAYSHQITAFTSLGANASYSRAESNDPDASDVRSNNGNFALTLSTNFTPKTTGSAGVTYSMFRPTGVSSGNDTDTLNIFAGIRHTF